MGKVIEFYLGASVAKKVKPIPIEQRGKLVEFPAETLAARSKTEDITERGEVILYSVPFFGCFAGLNERGYGSAAIFRGEAQEVLPTAKKS